MSSDPEHTDAFGKQLSKVTELNPRFSRSGCLMFTMLPTELVAQILCEVTGVCDDENELTRLPGLDFTNADLAVYNDEKCIKEAGFCSQSEISRLMLVCRLFYHLVKPLLFRELHLVCGNIHYHPGLGGRPLIYEPERVYDMILKPSPANPLDLCRRVLVVEPDNGGAEDHHAERMKQAEALLLLPRLTMLQILRTRCPWYDFYPEGWSPGATMSLYLRNAPQVDQLVIDNM